jgi:hypothetical protein
MIVLAAFAVGHVREQEGLAILLRDVTAELPPHQRVHFRILVDRTVDRDQQPGAVQRADVIVQIGIGTACG